MTASTDAVATAEVDRRTRASLTRIEGRVGEVAVNSYETADELAECRTIVEAINELLDGMTLVLVPRAA